MSDPTAVDLPEEGEPIEGGILAHFYRAIVVAYFILAPTYFWYRWLYTIEWDVPYRMYYQATICVAEMFGSICVMMLAVIRFPQPWAFNQRPPEVVEGAVPPRYTVHILVPCYNEPSDIVLDTCHAALQLRHPWAKVKVYLLDDGRNLEREKTVIMMGDERFIYVARPKFPGLPIHGKAGNLNHTLKFVIFARQPPTDSDVVVVFDADMKAHSNFLHHILPYLEEDPRTALVQTPQHFFNVDHTGDVFNHQNCTFFFGVQTGLDAWRATVCCGTNFAVRASALAAVGWFPTESITEDFLLSLKITASGWHCRYHGHVLVTGEAPEDLRQIFKQRSRWCTGCFQVFFQVETFMWVRQLPAIQMLCYFNSIMGYLSTIICFPVFTVVPIVSVYTKTHPVKELTIVLTALWAAYFLSMVIIIEMMPKNFSRFSGFLGSKVNYIMWWCFLKGMWKAVRGRLGLRKIVFKVTEKKGDGTKKRGAEGGDKKKPQRGSDQDGLLAAEDQKGPSGYTDAEVALMYGLVDEDGEYDEDAVRALQEELADAEAASNEEKRDSTKHDMKFHWLIFVSCFIVAVAGGVSKTLDTLQWGWDNTVLANVSVAWVVINMVPFGMALGYAYLPHQRTVRRHGTALRPDSVRT
mmetsp:Transcript_2380/g.6807  ORF Transcript_2380/g.6807 Transcript_2380/m.6807 type:complete len:636 (+) Transcript_2380:1568-3475(+)